MKYEDKNGNRLMKLYKISENEINERFPHLTHSLVVGFQNNRVLFIFNNWKNEFELPGGIIENNETPRECVIRELFEETNKQPTNLEFHSIMEWQLGKNQKKEFGALYYCAIKGEAEIIDSAEVGITVFWDLQTTIGEVAELDITLAKTILMEKNKE